MFSEEQITKIFSNIEQIYLFHQEILRQLEECFVDDDPYASEIGAVFLNSVSFIAIMILGGGWERGGGNPYVKGARRLREAGKERLGFGFCKGAEISHHYDVYCESRGPLRVEREPRRNYSSSRKFRSCCHQPSSPPINLPMAPLYHKLVVFEANYGLCYALQKQGFDIYSEYCNNHPHAMAELKTLCESNKYKQFFEVWHSFVLKIIKLELSSCNGVVRLARSLNSTRSQQLKARLLKRLSLQACLFCLQRI